MILDIIWLIVSCTIGWFSMIGMKHTYREWKTERSWEFSSQDRVCTANGKRLRKGTVIYRASMSTIVNGKRSPVESIYGVKWDDAEPPVSITQYKGKDLVLLNEARTM